MKQRSGADRLLVLKAAWLLDGTGRPPIEDAIVVVSGDVIVDCGPSSSISIPTADTYEEVELSGCWLLPGLIDTHVHLAFSAGPDPVHDLISEDRQQTLVRAAGNAQTALAAGITTVRDCGGPGDTVIKLRDAINGGLLVGPRVLSCGMPVTTTAGHAHFLGLEADGLDEVRKATRLLIKKGADFIKVMGTGGGITPGSNVRAAQYSAEEIHTVVSEASRLGRKVTVHVHGTEGIRNAVAAGVDGLEHCSWIGANGLEFDVRLAAEIVRKQIAVTPTTVSEKLGLGDPSRVTGGRKAVFDHLQRKNNLLRQMYNDGATILSGTDAGAPLCGFDQLALNCVLLTQELGLTRMDAILGATGRAAEALGIGQVAGSVEPGKRADIIAIAGDPLADLLNLQRVVLVIKAGVIVGKDGRLAPTPNALIAQASTDFMTLRAEDSSSVSAPLRKGNLG